MNIVGDTNLHSVVKVWANHNGTERDADYGVKSFEGLLDNDSDECIIATFILTLSGKTLDSLFKIKQNN